MRENATDERTNGPTAVLSQSSKLLKTQRQALLKRWAKYQERTFRSTREERAELTQIDVEREQLVARARDFNRVARKFNKPQLIVHM